MLRHWFMRLPVLVVLMSLPAAARSLNAATIDDGLSAVSLLTPACEVGVRVGWRVNQDAANFFSNVGFGPMF